jgi:hypothetical protein
MSALRNGAQLLFRPQPQKINIQHTLLHWVLICLVTGYLPYDIHTYNFLHKMAMLPVLSPNF